MAALGRVVPALVLTWLGLVFARTLTGGRMPLIERIARVGRADLPPALCRYTRRLTAVWCGYLVGAAACTLMLGLPLGWTSLMVWSGTAVLFVAEHRLRARWFPTEVFPSLWQQILDTCRVWRRGA